MPTCKTSSLTVAELKQLSSPYYTQQCRKHVQQVLHYARLIKQKRLNNMENATTQIPDSDTWNKQHMNKSAALSFIAGIASQATMLKSAADDYLTTTIKPGQTAYTFRKSVPGDNWYQQEEWLRTNNPNIRNINRLRPGDTLNIGIKPVNTYTVQPGDTLWKLRGKFTGNNWSAQLAEARRINPNVNFSRLAPGSVLNLSDTTTPAAKSPGAKAQSAKPQQTQTNATPKAVFKPHIYNTEALPDRKANAERIALNNQNTFLNTLAYIESNNNLYARGKADAMGRSAIGVYQFRNPAVNQLIRLGILPAGTKNTAFLGNQDLSDKAARAYVKHVRKIMNTNDPVVTYAGYYQGPNAFNKVKAKYLKQNGNDLAKAQRAWAQTFPAVVKFRDRYNQQYAKWN